MLRQAEDNCEAMNPCSSVAVRASSVSQLALAGAETLCESASEQFNNRLINKPQRENGNRQSKDLIEPVGRDFL